MKLLFLTSRLPYPPNRGDKLRVFNFLSRIAKNHSVTLASFIESKKQLIYVEELKKYCTNVEVVLLKPWESYLNCLLHIFSPSPLQVSYYRSNQMSKALQVLLQENKFDAVYVHLFRMAPYAQKLKGIKRILDLCDAVSLHMRRTIQFNRGILWPVYLMEWLRIKRYERKIISQFDEAVLISHADKQAILSDHKLTDNIHIVPNGVDSAYFKPAAIDNHKVPRIVFLGYLSTFYNLDAVRYFYHDIFPIVKRLLPGTVKFSIIGADCPKELKKMAQDNSVELFCEVNDTRPLLSQASVFVCPLRVGSGLQNKILEAMSMELPVVTTSIGYDGLGAINGKEIIVEDEPLALAERIVELIKDEGLRNEISANARKFIENNYRWENAVSKMEILLSSTH